LGENLALDRAGDSEQIVVDFTKLDVSVRALIFCVNSFSLIPFSKTQSIFVHVVDHSNSKDLAILHFDQFLAFEQKFTALVLCSVINSISIFLLLNYHLSFIFQRIYICYLVRYIKIQMISGFCRTLVCLPTDAHIWKLWRSSGMK
jgi:hypothetical protein